MCFAFCKDGVLYYCICSMYFKYPLSNEKKEEESASSTVVENEKTTTKNGIADVDDVSIAKDDEECLTPVYLGTSASLRTPHVQKDDPDEQLDL